MCVLCDCVFRCSNKPNSTGQHSHIFKCSSAWESWIAGSCEISHASQQYAAVLSIMAVIVVLVCLFDSLISTFLTKTNSINIFFKCRHSYFCLLFISNTLCPYYSGWNNVLWCFCTGTVLLLLLQLN